MKRYKLIISVVLLVSSIILLFSKLFSPQPIQITLESGQEITTSTSQYFSLSIVLLLVSCSFLIGLCAAFLFYNSDRMNSDRTDKPNAIKADSPLDMADPIKAEPASPSLILASAADLQPHSVVAKQDIYDHIMPLLKPEERAVISILMESDGETYQNKIVTKTGLSKVKATRLLSSLEQKGLILKKRQGITNLVVLKNK